MASPIDPETNRRPDLSAAAAIEEKTMQTRDSSHRTAPIIANLVSMIVELATDGLDCPPSAKSASSEGLVGHVLQQLGELRYHSSTPEHQRQLIDARLSAWEGIDGYGFTFDADSEMRNQEYYQDVLKCLENRPRSQVFTSSQHYQAPPRNHASYQPGYEQRTKGTGTKDQPRRSRKVAPVVQAVSEPRNQRMTTPNQRSTLSDDAHGVDGSTEEPRRKRQRLQVSSAEATGTNAGAHGVSLDQWDLDKLRESQQHTDAREMMEKAGDVEPRPPGEGWVTVRSLAPLLARIRGEPPLPERWVTVKSLAPILARRNGEAPELDRCYGWMDGSSSTLRQSSFRY